MTYRKKYTLRTGVADVPAIAFRQFGKLDEVK